ncbi:hypothetical protein NXC24_PA00161 (plasmid) [Rhizobium sp. NXC24]|nr:hypothetical protein NXC24_PA00161 [Rhizobium sp. NXC24]
MNASEDVRMTFRFDGRSARACEALDEHALPGDEDFTTAHMSMVISHSGSAGAPMKT